ncbi:MAG: AAA family ATPase, partial [Actinomycetota bacterium]|nr:AAA family ATPase [Actinomycetota bacterium]
MGNADVSSSLPAELPFVGRETALNALVSAVQAAELGERVMALVAGEPGIGKSRLVKEVTGRVSSRVLWAACWEGDGAPPYWPWLQLLRALGGERQVAEQIEVLAAEARPETARGAARFRLFDAVTDLFATASREEPLLVVLEDLHWADEASVRLLEFVAHDQRARRLAIIGTYREVDLDTSHPLSRALGGLVRDGLHLSLGGLGKRDVGALVSAMGEQGGESSGLVAVLHRKSGGNPFFLRELVRLLHEEGGLVDSSDGVASGVPAGVRPVVTRRTSRLAPPTREVLVAAAVAGAEFDVSLLGAVTGRDSDEVLAALDQARAAGLVVPTGAAGGFRFVHALVREVLYDESTLAARVALHRKLAEVIEQRYGDARPSELAHHVLQGAPAGGGGRAVDVAVRAAEHSFELLAYEEAAGWYGRALDVLRGGRPEDAREGRLLLRRGEAFVAAGDLPAARDAYQEAAAIARRHGDGEQLAQAALGLGAGFGGFEVQLLDPGQIELLEEALDVLGLEPSSLRAWVLARLSVALSFLDAEERRLALSEEAVAMAREVGDQAALGYALAGHCDAIPGPDHCESRLVEAAEVVRLGRQAGDRPLELLGRRLRLVALLEVGDVAAADREIERFAQAAAPLNQPLYRWYVPLWRGMRALMRGDVSGAARCCGEAEEIGAQAHSDNAGMLTFTQWWVRKRYEGEFSEAGRAMAELITPEAGEPSSIPSRWPYPAVAALQCGERERARAVLEEWATTGLEARIRDSEWLPETAQLAEAAVMLDCPEVARVLYEQLRPYAHRFCVEGIAAVFTGSVAWYLALAAASLGHTDEADDYRSQAAAAHRRVGLVAGPPPLASPAPTAAAAPASASAPSPAPSPDAPAAPDASLLWEGATWAVTYGGTSCRLRDGKGLRDLAVLLARPGEEMHCLELV